MECAALRAGPEPDAEVFDLSVQFGAPYIPIPKDRGFTANPDKYIIPLKSHESI